MAPRCHPTGSADAVRRWLLRLLALVLLLTVLLGSSGWWLLRGSLPRLSGSVTITTGLQAPVKILRDQRGTADIIAASRADAMYALGWLHGQERYFEMDLARRQAAGELAALLGPLALDGDRALRPHRFRWRAAQALARLAPARRMLLERYVDGINAGLANLSVRPWPYLLLSQPPERWHSVDSLLVLYAMYIALDDPAGRRERRLAELHAVLPPALYAFIHRTGTAWDAPLFGAAWPDPPIPGPEVLDLRRLPRQLFLDPPAPPRALAEGSNQFAVAGRLGGGGPALLANDMHLGLAVPNIWFRAQWSYPEPALPQGRRRLVGVTLPGLPGLVAGSNGELAWGFTNAFGDWMDWVRLEPVAGEALTFRTAVGTAAIEVIEETLVVAGAASETLKVEQTLHGPVLARDREGHRLALSWSAHQPEALGLALMDFETAATVEAALALAPISGTPPLNLLLADQRGHLAWTFSGPLPVRACPTDRECAGAGDALDWQLPQSSSLFAGPVHSGLMPADQVPVLRDPPSGRMWTANARVVGAQALPRIGDGGYDLGARAAQIRDRLAAREQFNEADLLDIQLDHRALFLTRWKRVLEQVLADAEEGPRGALREQLARWNGLAAADSVAYRIVRSFRLEVHRRVLGALAAPLRAADPAFSWPRLPQAEGVVWQLLEARPAHLLDPHFADWDELLGACADAIAADLGTRPGGLAAQRWGVVNTAAIAHPLAAVLPRWTRRWLSMPAQPLPGDVHMPRVQTPAYGASQRLVVGPGREAHGILQMPAGQTGHPLSPYFGAGHQDWVDGTPTPLLAGPAQHQLELTPAASPP